MQKGQACITERNPHILNSFHCLMKADKVHQTWGKGQFNLQVPSLHCILTRWFDIIYRPLGAY